MKAQSKKKPTTLDVMIVSALILIVISIGIRIYYAWHHDWPTIFRSMTPMSWIYAVAIIGLFSFIRSRIK